MLLDLKNVQETLERRGLVYDSKRGAGIWAHGREQDVRDMFIHIFAKADYDFRQFAKEIQVHRLSMTILEREGCSSHQTQFLYLRLGGDSF